VSARWGGEGSQLGLRPPRSQLGLRGVVCRRAGNGVLNKSKQKGFGLSHARVIVLCSDLMLWAAEDYQYKGHIPLVEVVRAHACARCLPRRRLRLRLR
jgi:hypothetical protein